MASTARRRRAPARAPGRTDEAGSTRKDECMHVHASRLSDALTLDEQRTHACYAGRARGASAALPLGRSAACRWNHPKRPAEELTRTERWCPLSVAWKRAACSAACSRGARWVEAAGGTPRTSRECACITWCSFSAGATNADTNAAPSLCTADANRRRAPARGIHKEPRIPPASGARPRIMRSGSSSRRPLADMHGASDGSDGRG